MDRVLLMNMASRKNEVFNYLKKATTSISWLNCNVPMDETLKRNSKFMFDGKGEIFLLYQGVYYSYEIIKEIIKKDGILTYTNLNDSGINK